MILHSIKIKNFRGIHKECTFDFNAPFILLSAQNGMGKTTVIDAVEWALTGTIGRLEAAYNTRSTNDKERRKNTAGILRNKDAAQGDLIQVELRFSADNEEFIVRRKQSRDILKSDESYCEYISGNDQKCQDLLSRINDGKFYQHHFCDIQKSINMQSYKRDEITNLFSEFISEYKEEECVADNLDLFIDDVDLRIEQHKQKKDNIEFQIANAEKSLEEFKNAPMILPYAQDIIFEEETTELASLKEEQLREQLEKLQLCAYRKCSDLLSVVMQDRTTREIIAKLEDLLVHLEKHGDNIREVFQLNKEGNVTLFLESLQQQLDSLKRIKINKRTLPRYIPQILQLSHPSFTQEYCEAVQQEIHKKQAQVKNLETDISVATDGNRVLNMLTDLIGLKDPLLEYRKQELAKTNLVRCPICGSPQFGQLNEDQILHEVRSYITANDRLVGEKKAAIEKNRAEIDARYSDLIKLANIAIEQKQQEYEKKLTHIQTLNTSCSAYFEILAWLKLHCTGETACEWSDATHVTELVKKYQHQLQPEAEISNNYRQALFLLEDILRVDLPHDKQLDMSIYKMAQKAGKNAPALISDASAEALTAKIRSIESVLRNQKYIELQKLLSEKQKELQNVLDDEEKLYQLKAIAQKKKSEILDVVRQLKDTEFESVGPYLRLLYKKLARVNSISEVHLKSADGKISLVDEQEKNIVNILSNGQLSVFVLAYFFAGILSRADNELCKIYFIDDLTACMDDVNMLAFLDLMKYQMLSERKNIEQIFFASCDYRVCELLRYKLEGSRIPFTELSDNDFAKKIDAR